MALKISDECIGCGACISECPNNAIYEAGSQWSISEGTSSSDSAMHDAVSDEHTFIVWEKCTQCVGFYAEPQCQGVCPVDCIHEDPDHVEDNAALEAKKAALHK